MRLICAFLILMGVSFADVSFSRAGILSVADTNGIALLIERVYKIPYRDAVCAFGSLNSKTRAYADKKFNDKVVREQAYKVTFGDVFSTELYGKLKGRCVGTNSADLKPDFRTGDDDFEDDYLTAHAPALKLLGRPIILERSADRVRVKVLWRQIYAEGKNTQVTNGRADLILLRQRGSWRVDDVWVNPSSEFHDLNADEFDKAVGTMRLRGGPPPA